MNTLELIKKLQEEKRSNHMEPTHVSYLELQNVVIRQLKDELNGLYQQGLIEIVQMINGKAVKIKENANKK